MTVHWGTRIVASIALLLTLSNTALAQDSGIAGLVTDASGGVLPGVTVEVTSPALIEGTRTVITDGQGRYSVTALRPGVYAVSFTLTGFAVVRREGISLNAGFTAPVNAEMKVGSLQETVTVTGASPTVDVQNVRSQNVLTRETLDQLPSGQSLSSLAALTVGVRMAGVVTQDVGGSQGEMGGVSIHNNRMTDQKISMEGMNTNNSMGTNGGVFHAGQHYNMEAMQEVTMALNGMSAETETAGAQVNYIPKDGGNIFSGSGRATFANEDFQSDNLTSELRSRGASTPPTIRKIWDYGGGIGGPLRKDKLWFFTAHRWWGAQTYQPGAYFNKTQGAHVYTPDLTRRAFLNNYNQDNSGRLTWQLSTKDKIAYYGNYGSQCICFLAVSQFLAPEAGLNNHLPTNHLSQVTWNRVQNNRLLFEGGFTYLHNPFSFRLSPGGTHNDIPHTDVATGITWNAFPSGDLPYNDYDGPGGGPAGAGQENGRISVSYVTGSHAFKAGFAVAHGLVEANGQANVLPGFGPVHFLLFNGFPILINQFANPQYARVDFRNTGFYAQDQWRVQRLTLNLGLRFDFFDGWSPEQETPAGAFVPAFRTQRIEGTPTWKDVSPRLGVAYDLWGNGKTAFKATAGRYVAAAGAGNVQPTNPILSVVRSSLRTWFDANGDFFPQANELGPLFNSAFGTPVVNTFFDPDMLTSNREFTWQMSAGVEHALTSGIGVNLTYFRTAHYNQTVRDNTLVTPSDFTPFCVTAPSDNRLPNSNSQVCGFADVSPARFGQVRTLVRNEGTFGDRTEVFNGVDLNVVSRFKNGALIQGGFSLGRTVTDNCVVVDSPQDLYQCRVVTPWWAGNGQVKLAASYTFKYGIEVSAVYQNLPGLQILAEGVFTNAQIAPSLGRSLSSCPAAGVCTDTRQLQLIQPQTLFEDRLNQVDFRLAKVFRNRGRTRVTLDLYNLTNSATIQARNDRFGPGWGTPTQILGGRLLKLGAQYNF